MENESITNGKDKTMEKVPKKRERRRKPDEAWTLFKSTYRDEKGERKESKTWSLDFRDCQDKRQRLSLGVSQRRTAESYAAKIDELKGIRSRGEGLSSGLIVWLESIPESLQRKLVKVGLIDGQRIKGAMSLSQHLNDFKEHQLSNGTTKKQVILVYNRISQVFSNCGFKTLSDISGSKVQKCIDKLRQGDNGISQQTSNYFLSHCKQFTKWLVDDRRCSENPLDYLKPKKVIARIKNRRALSIDELRHLFSVTVTQPVRYGMTGYDRYVLYRVASETGLRANELRSLTVSSFNLVERTVTVEAAYSKRRREDIIDIKADTCNVLAEYFQGKLPGARAFKGCKSKQLTDKTAKMLRYDLMAAGLPYTDEDGRDFDFHALRHQTATLLDQTDCTPKERQDKMRHSDPTLTAKYTHTIKGRSNIVEQYPDLSPSSSNTEQAKATGTDDKSVDGGSQIQRSKLCLSRTQIKKTIDNNGQNTYNDGESEKGRRVQNNGRKVEFKTKNTDYARSSVRIEQRISNP